MTDGERIKALNDKLDRVLEACPNLTFIGDKILRTKTNDTTLEEGLKIGEELKKVLAKNRAITGSGRGLAAPQIGENKSIFITYINDEFKIYINPKLIKVSTDCNLYRESCLSCGYTWADVKRPRAITLEYLNEQGETGTEEADGFLARLLQHEYDHLLGVVNLDKAEPNSIEFMLTDPLEEKLRDCQ